MITEIDLEHQTLRERLVEKHGYMLLLEKHKDFYKQYTDAAIRLGPHDCAERITYCDYALIFHNTMKALAELITYKGREQREIFKKRLDRARSTENPKKTRKKTKKRI